MLIKLARGAPSAGRRLTRSRIKRAQTDKPTAFAVLKLRIIEFRYRWKRVLCTFEGLSICYTAARACYAGRPNACTKPKARPRPEPL